MPSVMPGSPSSFFLSSLRFHGKNDCTSSGTLPPAAAQCSKYHVSHFRGLSFHTPTWPRSRTTPPSVDHSRATRAVEVLPRHRRAPLQSLRGVIVHRDPRVVHEQPQPLPIAPKLSKAFRQGVARSRGPVPSPSASSSWRRPGAVSRRLPRTLWRPAAPPSGGP